MRMMIRLSIVTTTCRLTVKAYKAKDSSNTTFKTIDGKNMLSMRMVRCCMAGLTMILPWLLMILTGVRYLLHGFLGRWCSEDWLAEVNVYDEEEDDDYDYWFNFKSMVKNVPLPRTRKSMVSTIVLMSVV